MVFFHSDVIITQFAIKDSISTTSMIWIIQQIPIVTTMEPLNLIIQLDICI